MPPNGSYSSSLDGSFRIVASKNPAKHGGGSALIENGVDLFGSSDQYFRATNAASDLYVQSAKNLNINSTAVAHLQGQNVNLTSAADSTLKCSTGQMIIEATAGPCTVKASSSSTLYLSGQTQQSNFTTVNINSVADTTIKSSGANATLQADSLEARVFGGSLAHVRAASSKLQATTGNVDVIAFSDVIIQGVNVSNTATTKASMVAPTCEIVASITSKVDALTVNLGQTSDNVNISSAGKQTTVNGNLNIVGNMLISGTTTSINTEQITIKDNLLVLNSASVVGKDAGILFNRNAADATSMYWDESELCFTFASTLSAGDSSTVITKDLQTVRAKNFVGDAIEMPGFKTVNFNLIDNALTAYEFTGLKTRGCYEFQIESVLADGAVYSYKICKSKASTNECVSFGIHQASQTDEEVIIKWDANKPPAVYHKTLKTAGNGANIAYVCKYISVN